MRGAAARRSGAAKQGASCGRAAGGGAGAHQPVLPGAQTVALVEQAVEVAGVLVAHLRDDLLDIQIAAAQQPRGRARAREDEKICFAER